MKSSHLLLSYAIVVIGIIHIVRTPLLFDTFDVEALWFVSGGLMAIFLGLINILGNNFGNSRSAQAIWITAGILSCIFSALQVYVMQDWRSVLIAVIVLALTSFSFLNIRKH